MKSPKKLSILYIIAFLALTAQVSAQRQFPGKKDSTVRAQYENVKPITAVLKTNILPMIWGPIPFTSEFRIVGEFMTTRSQSLSLGASYLDKSPLYKIFEKSNNFQGQPKLTFNGYRIQGAYKFYFKKNNLRPTGPYAAIHSSWSQVKIFYKQNPSEFFRVRHFNINALFGVQFLISQRLAFDVFIGPGYKNNLWTEHSSGVSKPYDNEMGSMYTGHFKFTFGFNIGVAL